MTFIDTQPMRDMRCVCGHLHAEHWMLDMTDCSVVGCTCKRWGLDDMHLFQQRLGSIRALRAVGRAIPGGVRGESRCGSVGVAMRYMPDTNEVQRMIDRAIRAALSTERTRLRALLLATAEKFGGPVQAALGTVQAALVELGEGLKEDNHG